MASISLFNNKTNALRSEIGAMYFVVRDSRTPILAKIIAVVVVAYALSPIDLVPDFIPVLGWIDDFLIIGLGLKLIKYLVPQHIWNEAKVKAAPIETKIKERYRKIVRLLIALWIALVLISASIIGFVIWWLVKNI